MSSLGTYVITRLFWREMKTSQNNQVRKYGLLTKKAGYWPSSFLRVYGPRRTLTRKKKSEVNIQPY